jgi:hypothetical protein
VRERSPRTQALIKRRFSIVIHTPERRISSLLLSYHRAWRDASLH